MLKETMRRIQFRKEIKVLILILMEHAQRDSTLWNYLQSIA